MARSDILHLFHTGYAEIREPDIHYGRKNADFGQGFYLSDSDEFAGKWMRERKDAVIERDLGQAVREMPGAGAAFAR